MRTPNARLANSRTVSLRSADRAEVIAAGRPCDRIEFAAGADLTGCIRRRSTAAGVERDERCEAALPWREIDGASVSTQYDVAALERHNAVAGKEQDRRYCWFAVRYVGSFRGSRSGSGSLARRHRTAKRCSCRRSPAPLLTSTRQFPGSTICWLYVR